MWRPPERVRWEPDPGIWPGADEAADAQLFQPVDIGPIALETRTWVPAMVPWRASGDGFVTDNILDWYGRFARGRPGAIVVEATGIRDVPSGPLLRIGDDRFIPGLADLAETVRRESDGHTKLFIQLIDFLAVRRRPDPAKYFERFLEITNRHRDALGDELGTADWPEDTVRAHLAGLPEEDLKEVLTAREIEALHQGYRERVTDTDLPQIAELPAVLPDLFADAARRARDAGVDGVELHFAHAYTMASFLSAQNSRGDGYGGGRENRARLPLEVYDAVRAAVGDDYVVGTRFLAEECIDGGNTVEDAAYFGAAFACAGFDVLSLSRGGKFEDAKRPSVGQAAYPYTGPSGYECMPQFISDARGPFGRNVAPVAEIRAAIRAAGSETPVVLTGGIHGFRQAEDILQADQADIIGFARQSLADPDWFRKVRSGHGDAVRVCEYTNYCEALDQKHVPVTCQLWDRKNLDEPGIAKTEDGKRRMVAPEWEPDKS
jgi:2,4-dienoyl-CoA reductase-like NADH-dependent reductase (Old Yellow Enzyme family)